MFGRKKKENLASWQTEPVTSTVNVNVEGLGTPAEQVAVDGEPLPMDPSSFTTRTVIDGGTTVIDARNVPGLRDELLKAVSDVRAGGNPAELQNAVMKAMSEGMRIAGQAGALPGAASAAPSPATPAALPGATPAASAAEDPLDRIEKLNELRRSGALTDEEFDAQKKKLLDEL